MRKITKIKEYRIFLDEIQYYEYESTYLDFGGMHYGAKVKYKGDDSFTRLYFGKDEDKARFIINELDKVFNLKIIE